jgi:hypothetical protein
MPASTPATARSNLRRRGDRGAATSAAAANESNDDS